VVSNENAVDSVNQGEEYNNLQFAPGSDFGSKKDGDGATPADHLPPDAATMNENLQDGESCTIYSCRGVSGDPHEWSTTYDVHERAQIQEQYKKNGKKVSKERTHHPAFNTPLNQQLERNRDIVARRNEGANSMSQVSTPARRLGGSDENQLGERMTNDAKRDRDTGFAADTKEQERLQAKKAQQEGGSF